MQNYAENHVYRLQKNNIMQKNNTMQVQPPVKKVQKNNTMQKNNYAEK